jgi:hypothetical protein
MLFSSYPCDPYFDIRSVVFCFDHTRVTPTLIYALSCSVLIIPMWPPLWYTLCCVLFWSYSCDTRFDIRSVVFCFDHTCLTPALIYALSCSVLIIPVWPPLWCTLCRVLFWSYPCDTSFCVRSVVFSFDHTRVTPTLIYALSCSVLIIPVWHRLWYTLCRVLFWSYPCDTGFDIRSVVFCFDHTLVTPALIYALSCSVLIITVWLPLWYALFPSLPSKSSDHCVVTAMVTRVYLIAVTL